jgi:hypothetical protein
VGETPRVTPPATPRRGSPGPYTARVARPRYEPGTETMNERQSPSPVCLPEIGARPEKRGERRGTDSGSKLGVMATETTERRGLSLRQPPSELFSARPSRRYSRLVPRGRRQVSRMSPGAAKLPMEAVSGRLRGTGRGDRGCPDRAVTTQRPDGLGWRWTHLAATAAMCEVMNHVGDHAAPSSALPSPQTPGPSHRAPEAARLEVRTERSGRR